MEPTEFNLTAKEKFLNLTIEELNSDTEADPLLKLIKNFNNVVDSYNFEPNIQEGEDFKIFSTIHNLGTSEEESIEIIVPIFNHENPEDIRAETCRGIRYKTYEEESYLVINPLETADIEEYLSMMKDIVKDIPEELDPITRQFLELDLRIFKNANIESSVSILVREFYKVVEILNMSADIYDVTKENFLIFKGTNREGGHLGIMVPNIDLANIDEMNTAIIKENSIVSPIITGDIEEYLNAMKDIIRFNVKKRKL
jgi:hypothetical protein